MFEQKRKKINPLLICSMISFILVSCIMVGLFFYNQHSMKSLISEFLQENKALINSISIKNEKGKLVLFTNNISEKREQSQKIEFADFMEKYYETQSNWLNFWLTILALFLGVLGIVIPICFMKFYEDKKEEINSLIKDTKDLRNDFNSFYKQKKQEFTDLYGSFKETAKKEAKKQLIISRLISRMDSYKVTQNYYNMLQVAEEIIKREADNYYAYYGKAFALTRGDKKLQDLNVALKNINKSIKINSKDEKIDEKTLELKAEILIKVTKFEQALEIYENIEEKDFSILSNMIELKIILNKLFEAKQDLAKLKDKIENTQHTIVYKILELELNCIESSNPIDKEDIIKNIFALDTINEIDWSFEEIKYLLRDNSYLSQKQKIKLESFIHFIEEENKLREERYLKRRNRLENIKLRNISYKEKINNIQKQIKNNDKQPEKNKRL